MADRHKYLIVTADDFGMSRAVNEGILRAHREGILTSASLMVNGRSAEDAVALARDNPSLAVGLHLVLVQGYPVSPAAEIPLLVGGNGLLRSNPVSNGIRFFFLPGARAQLRREITAQLDKFRASGVTLSHIDGHLNVHTHPSVLPILLSLREHYGIRAMRVPRDPLGEALRFDRSHLARKVFEGVAFSILCRWTQPRLAAHGILHADVLYGLHQTGNIDERYLLYLIPRIRPGITEIYCHAGLEDEESRRWRPAAYRPRAELAALTSPRVREEIERHGVVLTSYRALLDQGARSTHSTRHSTYGPCRNMTLACAAVNARQRTRSVAVRLS